MQSWGYFGKFRIFATRWALRFLKIEEEITEKVKPKVGNPPLKIGGIPCSQYFLSHFFFNFAFWMSLVVVMAIFQTLDTL